MGQSPPDIQALLTRLATLVPIAENAATGTAQTSPADSDGRALWRCTFQPTAEPAARGVNVNRIRARLQSLGELLRATPQVTAQGITFEFLLASNAEAEAFAGGANDGLVCVREDVPATKGFRADGAADGLPAASSQVVGVNLARLDDLMRMVGDLVVSRSRLENQLQRLETVLPAESRHALQESNLALERGLRDLREGVMCARMVPIAEVFERMPFVVRDLARDADKQVRLDLHGQHTEIDKYLVERMMDPLLHLVRNAVSHRLEPAAERRALGKPAEGRLSLRAATVGESVLIEIEDDGRGLDADQVLARARAAGLHINTGAEALLEVICTPGFFTRFTMELPLTLAIADVLIVYAGGQRFAVPQAAVHEVLAIEPTAVKTLENKELIAYRGGVLPLLRLAQVFDLPTSTRDSPHVFVVGDGLGAVGIAVDRIAGQCEIVVRALNDPLIKVPGIAGTTELGDGRVVLILDVEAIKRKVVR